MKRYIKPVVEMIEIDAVDVIQASNGLNDGGSSGSPENGGWPLSASNASVYDKQ